MLGLAYRFLVLADLASDRVRYLEVSIALELFLLIKLPEGDNRDSGRTFLILLRKPSLHVFAHFNSFLFLFGFFREQ